MLFIVLFLLLQQWIPAISIGAALIVYWLVSGKKHRLPETAGDETANDNITPAEAEAHREALWEDDRNKQHLITQRAVLQQKRRRMKESSSSLNSGSRYGPGLYTGRVFYEGARIQGRSVFLLDAYSLMKDVKKK